MTEEQKRQRLVRIKTATAMMVALLSKEEKDVDMPWMDYVEDLAVCAVLAADALLAEVERTAPAEDVAGEPPV